MLRPYKSRAKARRYKGENRAVCADARGYATHAACLILPLLSND